MSGALPAVPLEALTSDDPRELGGFRLLGRLGSGGMGIAYLAEGPGGWAVVKTLWPQLRSDASFRQRMARERDAMRAATSPGVAAVLADDLASPNPWIAMEFVPGVTLKRTIEENGALTGLQLQQLASGLASILAKVHSAGVVHRDLKPANIMISPAGPRLIDFGVADVTDATQLTATGVVVGTAGWLAPEQITGGAVSPATDVHAWGLCTLYAATATAPFAGENTTATIYQVLHTTPDLPASLGQWLTPWVSAALAKDPAARPTAQQLTASLTGVQTPGIPAVAPSPATRAEPHPLAATERRAGSPMKAALLGAAIALIAIALVAGAVMMGRASADGGASASASASASSVTSPQATATATTPPSAAASTTAPAEPATCKNGGTCSIGDVGPGGGTVFFAGTVTVKGAPTVGFLEVAAPRWWESLADPHPAFSVEGPFDDPRISWCNPGVSAIGVSTSSEVGSGSANTRNIRTTSGCAQGAAALAASYRGGNRGDWYLPSIDELAALCRTRPAAMGGWSARCEQTPANSTSGDYTNPVYPYAYWSSTQTPDGTDKFALCQPCRDTPSNDDDFKLPSPFYAHPIRAFAATG